MRNLVSNLFQLVTLGLAAAFIIVFLRPELLDREHVVQIQEDVTPVPVALPAGRESGPVSYRAAVERAAPSVVNINTAKIVTTRVHPLLNDPFFRRFFGDSLGIPRKRLQSSLGSGVIVSTQGYILTNHHVIDGADQIQVQLHDGRKMAARVVGSDADTDLAILHIELDDLPAITLGDSEGLAVGDVVLAIGNPFGVGQTVTMGIVSATGRSKLGINTFENFIQTDAAINPGNSGGALIDSEGRLIGINTAIFSKSGGSQGIGFAIPTSLARGVMKQIIEHGRVMRGWFGVEAQDLTEALAESFGLNDQRGVLIAGIYKNGPAAQAGMRPGDIITRMDGKPINDSSEVLNFIALLRPGTSVRIKGFRAGQPMEWTVTVIERPTGL